MTFDMQKLEAQLTLDEGKRFMPYKDSTGHLTVGIGHNLDANPLPGQKYPMTEAQVDALFAQDVAIAVKTLNTHLLWWEQLDDPRQRVMIDLTFNLGIGGLQTFTTFLHYMRTENYDMAAKDLEGTLWYRQVGTRGPRVVALLKS